MPALPRPLAACLAGVLALLPVPAPVASRSAWAAPSVAQEIARALRENDDRERALLLETALRGADSVEATDAVLERLLPRARSAVDTEVGIHALSRMRDPQAVAALSRFAEESADLQRRAEAIEALGRSVADGASSSLLLLAGHADPRVRTAAVNALGERHDAVHDDALVAALDDADPRVRSAAVWALARQGRTDAVPHLAAQMRREDGRLVDDCADALASLTGKRFGPRPSAYLRGWLEENGEPAPDIADEWEAPAPSIDSPLLATRSRRVLVVLSVGESMKDEIRVPALSPAARAALVAAGEDLVEQYDHAKTKMDLARVHAIAMLRRLREGTLFDVAVYAASPTFAFGELVPADDRTRKKAETRIAGLSPGGGGNLHEMLRRIGDPRGKDPLAAEGGPDTVILFSDGRLAAPGVTDRNQVVMEEQRWNRVRQVRFLVVSLQPADDAVLGPLSAGPPAGFQISLP